jgi:hypothetical protein
MLGCINGGKPERQTKQRLAIDKKSKVRKTILRNVMRFAMAKVHFCGTTAMLITRAF